MAQSNSTRDRQAQPAHQVPAPPPALYFLIGAAGVLAIVSLTPPALILPALSLAAMASAAAVALLAWLCGAERHSNGVTPWDVAGALAFIGFAAGMLTGPEHIREFIGPETMAR
jgi:hypothetical protein